MCNKKGSSQKQLEPQKAGKTFSPSIEISRKNFLLIPPRLDLLDEHDNHTPPNRLSLAKNFLLLISRRMAIHSFSES
jgi:hypothetical protein